MYGFSEYVPLDIKEILLRVSQEDIWNLVLSKFGRKVELNCYVTNPLRADRNAGAWFNWYNGRLRLNDFGNNVMCGKIIPKNIHCFDAVSMAFGVNFYQGLQLINQHFNLGLGGNTHIAVAPIIIDHNKSIVEEKLKTYIEFKAKEFDKYHKAYWANYQISKQNLVEDNVFATYWFRSKKGNDTFTFLPNAEEVTYTIGGFKDNRVKVCRAKAKDRRRKWFTNCVPEDIGFESHISYLGKQLVIHKSWKDARVVKNQGVQNNIWLQNEVAIPYSKLIAICRGFDDVPIIFDNDETGVKNSALLNQVLRENGINSRQVFVPQSSGCKDESELIAARGSTELKSFLQQNAISF